MTDVGDSARRDGVSLIRESLGAIIAGIALGLAIVFAGARAVDDMLYGLTSTDAATMAAAAAALLVSALLAASIPAIRAARLDPMTALRAE